MRFKLSVLKLFVYSVFTITVGYIYFYRTDTTIINYKVAPKIQEPVSTRAVVTTNKDSKTKYILQWTSPNTVPFAYMGKGKEGFTSRNCQYTDCVVTSDKMLLGDYTKFDVIAFCGTEVIRMDKKRLPQRRSPHQKYVFGTIESADNYPVCSNGLDNFFNWTWTYRLTSEAKWGYMTIRDENKRVVGPKMDMKWIDFDKMKPVSDRVKNIIKNKTKTAAWFVSNCVTRSKREKFVKELQVELSKYDLTVDIYGRCGPLKCSRADEDGCNEMLGRDYYFYLSFENSFAEDYATEKLLFPLKYHTVPIVYGGANYSRFAPQSAYINARELGVQELARKMNYLIENPEEYLEYFRWTNHYSYHTRGESIETDDYCRFCSILFEDDLVKKHSVYENFREWWDPPLRC